jgi:glycosyltransferase involved in cell wall biosynthesis
VTDLTIIIPTFNRLWALPKAIESCRATRSPHEIIVVDDGGTDGTSEWLDRQPDIVKVRTDNWGKDWAVNTAFARARGEYVRFLDSDDWLETEANDAQLEIARRTGADIVVAGYRTYEESTNAWIEAPWEPCDDFIAQQLGERQGSHYSAFLFRRSFIEGIPHRQEFGANDDRMFILEVALRQPKVAIYDKFALVHLHHSRSRLQAPKDADVYAQTRGELKIYEKFLPMLAARGELTQRRKRAPLKSRLWPLAHRLGRYDIDVASGVVRWIYELDPDFQIPGEGFLPAIYRKLGFRRTTQLLDLRRRVMRPLQGVLERPSAEAVEQQR